MTAALIEETKKAIGYTEKQNTCQDCKHSKEEDEVNDRSWDWVCRVNNLCPFVVNPNGRCNLHEKRTNPQP